MKPSASLSSERCQEPQRFAWLWPLLAFLPLVAALPNSLQEVDTAQYAEVARRIVVNNEWVRLYDVYGDFLNKPPLTLWLQAVSMKIFGFTSFAGRLPSFLAAALIVFVVARIGTLLWNRTTGWLAAILLASSPAIHLMVADPKIDAVVTACMTCAVGLAVESRRKPFLVFFSWVLMGLGVLAKGPIGVVLPTVALLPEAIRRRWGLPEGALDGSAWKRLAPLQPLLGPVVAIAVAAPWFFGMTSQFGSAGPYFILWEQSFGRLLHRSNYSDNTSPLYFLHTGLWAYLPFSLLVLYELTARAKDVLHKRSMPPDERRIVLWWFLIPFIAISFNSFKLPQYGYWLAPPAALLAARGLLRALDRYPSMVKWVEGGALVFVLLSVMGMGLVFGWVFPSTPWVMGGWVLGTLLIVGGGWLWSRARFPLQRVGTAAALSLLAFHLFFHAYVHRSLLTYQPEEMWGRWVKQTDPHGRILPFVSAGLNNAAAYYSNREVREVTLAELSQLVSKGETQVAILPLSIESQMAEVGLVGETLAVGERYHTSMPRKDFLNARTRPATLERVQLVRVRRKDKDTPATPNSGSALAN